MDAELTGGSTRATFSDCLMSGVRVYASKNARDVGLQGRGRILLVEDVPEDRGYVERILRDASFEPVFTDKPDEVTSAVERWSPRAIILSADVPHGFTVCHRLKKDKGLRRIPLILVSGRARPDVIRKHRMLPTRADHYLAKPVDREALLGALAELLPEELRGTGKEIAVTDVPDRTLVGGGLETAVVTYVEEEVSSLRSRLNSQVQALERQLEQERTRLDAALRALAEHERAEREVLAREQVEAARESGWREAKEESRAELEALRARVAELESEIEVSRKETESLRTAVRENQALFERLEAGYRESIATLEDEKRALESAVTKLEAEVDSLRDERDALKEAVQDLPRLQEAGARSELLEEELRRVRVEKQSLETRVEELMSEVAALEAADRTLREELRVAKEGIAVAEEARKTAEETLASMRSEQEEMRQMLRRLKSVLDSVMGA